MLNVLSGKLNTIEGITKIRSGYRDLVNLIFDYRLSLLDPVIMNGKVSATFMGDCSSLPYPLKYKERYYIDLSRLNSKCC